MMKVSDKVKKILETKLDWNVAEINATKIFKGWNHSGYGYYLEPFGENPIFLGEDWDEVKETLDGMVEYHDLIA